MQFVHEPCLRWWFIAPYSRFRTLHPSKWKCEVCEHNFSWDLSFNRRMKRSVLYYYVNHVVKPAYPLAVKTVIKSNQACILLTLHVTLLVTMRQIDHRPTRS